MKRFFKWTLLTLLTLVLLAAVAGILTLRSTWFRDKLRERLIAEIERATGGVAEVKALQFNWTTMNAGVTGFVLHGTEDRSEPPLFRADSIRLGLKVISPLKRQVDLAALVAQKPLIHIVIYPDGHTNVPRPKVHRAGGKPWQETVLSLKVKEFAVVDGLFEFNARKIPVDLHGENLNARLFWEAEGPRYSGHVSMRQLRMKWPPITPESGMAFDTDVDVSFDSGGLSIHNARAAMAKSTFSAKGRLNDWASPRLSLDVTGNAVMSELARPLRLPIVPTGDVQVKGQFNVSGAREYSLTGTLNGQGLAVRQSGVYVHGVRFTSKLALLPDDVRLHDLSAAVLDGSFRGTARITGWKNFTVQGESAGLTLDKLSGIFEEPRPMAWSGVVSGPVTLNGAITARRVDGFTAQGSLSIAPIEGAIPVEGALTFAYDRDRQQLRFGQGRMKTAATEVEFLGPVSEKLFVKLTSKDLNDFLPAVEFVTGKKPEPLPVTLDNGEAAFTGNIEDLLGNPRITGTTVTTGFVFEKRKFDRLRASIELTRDRLQAGSFRLELDGMPAQGSAEIGLSGWKISDASTVTSSFAVRDVSMEQVLKETNWQAPVSGSVSGSGRVEGTIGKPAVTAQFIAQQVTLYDEHFDRIRADVTASQGSVDVRSLEAQRNGSRITASGRYEYPDAKWKEGSAQIETAGTGLKLSQWNLVRNFREGLDGRFEWKGSAAFVMDQGLPRVKSLTAQVDARDVTLNKQPFGHMHWEARTTGNLVEVATAGELRGVAVRGSGEWQLSGDAHGLGQLQFAPLTVDKLQEILATAGQPREFPFNGAVEGDIVIAGPLRKPRDLHARVELSRFELRPRTDEPRIGNAKTEDLNLRNNGPLVFEIDYRGVQVKQARLIGNNTNLEASGTLSTQSKTPWNLTLKGGLNLAVFQEFEPGLTTTGTATLNATVRGTLERPQLNGRMDVKDASVYYRDIPNGIDNANGVVLFDRNRALLQNLTAQTGGGALTLGGFVTFGGDERSYRLQLQAQNVRIRYPEGASTTMDGALNLTGTEEQGLVSGTMTVLRSGFTPRTDIASLLLQPQRPITTPGTTNPLLRGLQFDVRINSAPNLQLETSLTQGIQADVDLRLRGSPVKPVLLGRVTANQGEILFFGTKYTITRGEVAFFNPARLEPVVDMDLETVVRAITVNITLTGPLNKLNVTYRSDPPLQSSEIIALLAVGRAPDSNTSLAANQILTPQNAFQSGADTILGQAVSAGVSSRLQRFFGVSRLKIDPQLTGLDTTPQARLTLEQQISRDVTFTYITNLTGANQQVLRLQWDIRREWSITAVRDENGFFALDILYRRRFK